MSAEIAPVFAEYINQTNFQFNNCTEAAAVWEYFNGLKDYQPDSSHSEQTIYGFIIHALEEWTETVSLQTPSLEDGFLQWAYYSNADYSAEDYTIAKCPDEYCGVVGWTGSPDLSGPGVLASYLIQAILVTIYVAAIIKHRFFHSTSRSSRLSTRTFIAIKRSTSEFLMASSLYSVSLLAASTFSIARSKLTSTFTAWGLSLIIPINSVLPVVILSLAAADFLPRLKGRAALWVVIGALAVALAARSHFAFEGKFNFSDDYTTQLEKACTGGSNSTKPMTIFAWIIAGLVVLGIFVYIIALFVSVVRHQPKVFGRCMRPMRWVILGLSLCTMWVLLVWFVRLTLKIRKRAKDKNDDGEWTFGQMLALATWVPFMIEFAYQWWEEPGDYKDGNSPELIADVEMKRPGKDGGRGVFQRLDSGYTGSE